MYPMLALYVNVSMVCLFLITGSVWWARRRDGHELSLSTADALTVICCSLVPFVNVFVAGYVAWYNFRLHVLFENFWAKFLKPLL